MKISRIIFTATAVLAFALSASAEFSFKYPCSDSMVLQQNTDALVWGHGDAGKKVSLKTSWDGKSYSATVETDGVWRVYVKTPAASYSHYEITAKCGSETFTIHDVLVGEVWIASGQSNMEMPLRGFTNCPVEGYAQVQASPAGPDKVRMFTVAIYQPFEPVADVQKTRGWEKAIPGAVAEMSATAYFFAEQLNRTLDVPVGILAFPRGGARVESWLPRSIVESYGTEDCSPEAVAKMNEYTQAYVMYNGMEQPVKGYTARGFIWYQGCSNVGNDDVFVPRMTDLVRQWREDWGDRDNAMPFYQVEVAPYRYAGGQQDKASALRQAQHQSAKVIPNSAIVCTNDLAYSYEEMNIHPCMKQPVGQRLAYLALHRDYGFEGIPCYSPEAVSVSKARQMPFFGPVSGNAPAALVVKTENCPEGIDRMADIKGLEIAGADGVFHPVTNAFYMYNGGLMVSSPEVADPVTVRYGWGDFNPGNLHGADGLPFVPFCLSVE